MSFSRKIRRQKANKKKKIAEKEMATKVALFGKLPSKCLTCDKPFDKMNKEQVMSWSVVVRENEDRVNLYCPPCWERAQKMVQEFKKYLEEKNDS
tara:strand:+ start:4272 stop:4556 length:285 start_codon:yes stop_codon:yes gene_type:complete